MSIKTRAFAFGFGGTLLLFIGLNLLSAHLLSDCGLLGVLNVSGCTDDIRRVGFPLLAWEEGGFAYRQSFNAVALFMDLVIALGASVVVGLVSRWWGRRTKV